MSSPLILQSRMLLRPASVMRLRKLDSQSSPNLVSPTPMTATSRILRASGGGELDLAAELGVRGVVDLDAVEEELFDAGTAGASDLVDAGRDGQVEGVAAGAA